MAKNNRSVLLGAIGALAIAQGVFINNVLMPTWSKDYAPKGNVTATPGLDPGQFLAAMAGFREMVAGILWVRADAFFDQGNYDAILPIMRLVTILDPHQIDVYATGMWHIGYNFTDEQQRSDRRYLPSAINLGSEGATKNPNTYELFFETGWMWMHKVDDNYPKAVYWFTEAGKRKDMPPARYNMLAKAYEREGDIPEMINFYFNQLGRAKEAFKKDPQFNNSTQVDVVEQNLDNLLVRMVQRGYQAKKLGIYDSGDYDTKPPFDVGFSAKVTVTEANVLYIEGTWNVLPLGTRIRVVLRDADFPNTVPGGVKWDEWDEVKLDPNKNLTYMQDQLYVRNQRFNKRIDMSRDPAMYPFRKDNYILEFYYNPRSAPPHIQDKLGWNGDGMTDKNFLKDNLDKGSDNTGRKGVRCMYYAMPITKEMIRRQGKYALTPPVIKTPNYDEAGSLDSEGDTIIIPSLRGK